VFIEHGKLRSTFAERAEGSEARDFCGSDQGRDFSPPEEFDVAIIGNEKCEREVLELSTSPSKCQTHENRMTMTNNRLQQDNEMGMMTLLYAPG